VKKHFVTFYSPGTFMAEESTQEIDSWDVDKAVKLAKKVKERYGARPYGFQFSTRERGPDDFNSKETKRSGTYYLGGKVWTLAQLEKKADPKEEILRSNMRGNGWDKVVVNDNSWRWTQPLQKNDTVLDVKL
jgi:ATP sulfurylase